jgi:steroid 5-alpha reductase family enzyme
VFCKSRAQVSLWWAFYLFSVSATGEWFNWTIWGTVFLTGLFVPPGASLDLTEMLSSRKYPAYEEYQRTTSRFVPWFPSSKAKAK